VSKLRRSVAALLASLLVATVGVSVLIQTPAQAHALGNLFGPYTIRAAEDLNHCLDITGVSQANGALAQMYTCLGNQQYNQVFYFWAVEGSADRYQITPAHSWKCLDIQGVSHADGARVQQYDCLGVSQENQVFDVFYYSQFNGYVITPVHSWRPIRYYNLNNGASVYQQGDSWKSWVLANAY
jgi:hypothetical protein